MATTFKTAAGEELVLSPFVLAATRVILPLLPQLRAAADGLVAQCDATIPVLVEALRRKNPHVTAAWLDENIQTRELGPLLTDVMASSGLEAAKPGEAQSP